jgi:hypothetical protein
MSEDVSERAAYRERPRGVLMSKLAMRFESARAPAASASRLRALQSPQSLQSLQSLSELRHE